MAGFTKVSPSLAQKAVSAVSVVTTGAHANLDQVGTIYQFTDVLPPRKSSGASRSLTVVNATLIDIHDQAAVAFKLQLFSRSVTLAADDAAASISDADALFSLGYVNFLSTDVIDNDVNKVYNGTFPNGSIGCVLDDIDADGVSTEDLILYGQLQVLGAYTPGTTVGPTIKLIVVQD